MQIELTETEKARFWTKVRKTDSCWEWTGGTLRGHGVWRLKRGNFRASHVSYQLTYGSIPQGKQVHHRCNNRLCVNPTHLSVELPNLLGLTDTDITRFWTKVQKTDTCWKWTGTTQRGYGLFRIATKNLPAHRLSYQLAYGEIPPEKMICHRCNNSLCVNPVHLYAGTAQDNVNDAMACGHQIHGMSHHRHKLTDEQIKEIRQLYPAQSSKKLASLYGVSYCMIWRIVTHRNWRHI